VRLSILCDLLTNYSGLKFFGKLFFWRTPQETYDAMKDWMNRNGFDVDWDRKVLQRSTASLNGKGADSGSDSKSKVKVYTDFLIERLNDGEIEYDAIFPEIEHVLAAAIDTSSNTVSYGVLLLAKNPAVQQRVYEELVSVMEKNGLKEFEYSILNQLHLFRAWIHELVRIGMAALGLPHRTTEEVTIEYEGKKTVIPKGTVCHQNNLYISRWSDWNDGNKPLKNKNDDIHLEYWLDPETGAFKMDEKWVGFGVGRRDCAGRSLAMKSLYATFALFLLRYQFVAANDDPDAMDLQQKWGLVPLTPHIGVEVKFRE